MNTRILGSHGDISWDTTRYTTRYNGVESGKNCKDATTTASYDA